MVLFFVVVVFFVWKDPHLTLASQAQPCWLEGKPSCEHESTCSMVKLASHLYSVFVGILNGVQPYLKARVSMNTLLWRANPCSSSEDLLLLEQIFAL